MEPEHLAGSQDPLLSSQVQQLLASSQQPLDSQTALGLWAPQPADAAGQDTQPEEQLGHAASGAPAPPFEAPLLSTVPVTAQLGFPPLPPFPGALPGPIMGLPDALAPIDGLVHDLPGVSRDHIKHPSLLKPEHEDSKAKRRGPMDEMRQLVRIMVKLLPQSVKYLSTNDEPGGGNRVTEPQIKTYLKNTLGEEAPQPKWGMPEGWGAYLSDLFTWALGRDVTDEEARSCACRQQGRSWQINETRLAELGIFTYAWPLPLTVEGVMKAQENPGDPPAGTAFIGPPPGWPDVELPYWQSKKAKAKAIVQAPMVHLAQPSKEDLDVANEKQILETIIPQLMAASRKCPRTGMVGVLPSTAASCDLFKLWEKVRDTANKMCQVHLNNMQSSAKDALVSATDLLYSTNALRANLYSSMAAPGLAAPQLTAAGMSPHRLAAMGAGLLPPGMSPQPLLPEPGLLPAAGPEAGSQQHLDALINAVRHMSREQRGGRSEATTEDTDGTLSAPLAASEVEEQARGSKRRRTAGSGAAAPHANGHRRGPAAALSAEDMEVESISRGSSRQAAKRAKARGGDAAAGKLPRGGSRGQLVAMETDASMEPQALGRPGAAGLTDSAMAAKLLSRLAPGGPPTMEYDFQAVQPAAEPADAGSMLPAGMHESAVGQASTNGSSGAGAGKAGSGPSAQMVRNNLNNLFERIEQAGLPSLPADGGSLLPPLPPLATGLPNDVMAGPGGGVQRVQAVAKPAASRSITSPRKAKVV